MPRTVNRMNLKNSVGSATKFTDFLSEVATSTATLQLLSKEKTKEKMTAKEKSKGP
jgi:hypothetical protein